MAVDSGAQYYCVVTLNIALTLALPPNGVDMLEYANEIKGHRATFKRMQCDRFDLHKYTLKRVLP